MCHTGARALGHGLHVPRSTISSWKRRGPRAVVSLERFGHDREQLLTTIDKLEKRTRILAATIRLLLALLRASGFRLAGERLPEGATKDSILRAITRALPALPLNLVLRIIGLPPSRYHAWRRVAVICGLDGRSPCPRTVPGQLTSAEIATVKDMVLAPEYRHMALRTLSLDAQRIGKVFAASSAWARLVRERGWRRPRLRVHPAKPTVAVRATRPNEIWHIDVSVLKLLDGTKAYIHAVIDNFSRRSWPGASARVSIPPQPAGYSSKPASISLPPTHDQRSRSWPTLALRTSTPPSTRPFWPKAFTASSLRSRSPSPTR